MKLLFILSLILLSACQDYNSNSSDRERFGPVQLDGSGNFQKAYPILMKRCGNCHYHSVWPSYKKESDWIDENLIEPGSAERSRVIIRTINTGGTEANMPQGGSALPRGEYDVLTAWIDGLE